MNSTISDSQLNATTEDFEDDGNFHIQLSSTFKFKLQPGDLMQLKSIRTRKINRKTARVFEAMGLPIDIDDKCKKRYSCQNNRKKELLGE